MKQDTKIHYIKPNCADSDILNERVLCGSSSLEGYSQMEDDENINGWL